MDGLIRNIEKMKRKLEFSSEEHQIKRIKKVSKKRKITEFEVEKSSKKRHVLQICEVHGDNISICRLYDCDGWGYNQHPIFKTNEIVYIS